jgi:hypothetical protein
MIQAAGISTAIRQLMSRGRPPKSTSPLWLAHIELVAALAGNVPHRDLSADAVGVIRNAAEVMREDENWRAP